MEYPFYLLPGFHPEWLRDPKILAATCVLPYLAYSLPTQQFRPAAALFLVLLSLLLSYWFKILPKSALTDLLFIALAASVYISKVFDSVYTSPIAKVPFSALGHIMLIRTCALALISIRGDIGAEFRFVPTKSEALTGLKWALPLLAASAVALWCVGLWNIKTNPNIPAGIATFFGILWVTALSEEFIFRGLLQQWLGEWTGNAVVALFLTSLTFGAAHLGWNHAFPNFRFAAVASVFGLVCGLCFRQSKSVQASMLTHAIGATLYKVFFTS
jgi:membrane protease YdiL (CAAX protease family)